jgi:triacylglycerol lipase
LVRARVCRQSRYFNRASRFAVLVSKRYNTTSNDTPDGTPGSYSPVSSKPSRDIINDFAAIRSTYRRPKHPIVLAHGLFGFDELRLLGHWFPGVHYWRGIREALEANGIEVIIASVPASGSIEERAERLARLIEDKAGGKEVNIIA